MKSKVLWVVGISAALYLLFRSKSSATPIAAATSSGAGVSLNPIDLASIYFDPGQTETINANVSSPTYADPLVTN